MKKLGYTLLISVISTLLFQSYFYFANVNSEMFYTIGTLSIVVLYFLIGYPTLLIVSSKPKINSRSVGYLLATLIGIILFLLFYITIGELEKKEILNFLIPYSFLFGIIGGILFFVPMEIARNFKKTDIV